MNWCLLLTLYLFLVSEVSSQNTGTKKAKVTRSLASTLQCPEQNNDFTNDDSSSDTSSAELAKFSEGRLGVSILGRIRGKDEAFYQNVLNNLVMTFCNVAVASARCVPEASFFAEKDDNGQCIVASNFTCSAGMCERTSNCYWKSVQPGVPRAQRFSDEQFAEAHTMLMGATSRSYVGGIVTIGLIGIIVGIALQLLWAVFIAGRYCCCCLWETACCFVCSPKPRKDGYSFCSDIGLPLIVYIFSIVVILLAGVLSFIGNADMDTAATYAFYHSSHLLGDTSVFLQNARVPLVDINDITQTAALNARGIFNDTGYVQTTAHRIVTSFIDFGVQHSDGINASHSQGTFDSAVTKFSDDVSPVVAQIQDMLDTLEFDLYDKVDLIQNSILAAVSQVDSIINITDKYEGVVGNTQKKELHYRPIRKACVLGLFALSLAFALAGFFGVISFKTKYCHVFHLLLRISWVMCAILGSVAFIMAAVTLTVSVVWYDACQMSNIVTSNFEPYLGDKIAPGANACFDGTNLAVAFNVTNKIDFQGKLDDGLAIINSINITAEFSQVTSPLLGLQNQFSEITAGALEAFNSGTSFGNSPCPFNDSYTENNVLDPWTANVGKTTTSWVVISSGTQANYSREGLENSTEYIRRIYSIAGKCRGAVSSCCLQGACSLQINDWCDQGDDCTFDCSGLVSGIIIGYGKYLVANDIEESMTADLGVECPTGYSCPTEGFRNAGNNDTILGLLHKYESNITRTSGDLIHLASTSVGEVMVDVREFLCDTNVSFVGEKVNRVRSDFCQTLLGGFTQITWALWILAVALELAAISGSILAVRLKGCSKKEARIGQLGRRGITVHAKILKVHK